MTALSRRVELIGIQSLALEIFGLQDVHNQQFPLCDRAGQREILFRPGIVAAEHGRASTIVHAVKEINATVIVVGIQFPHAVHEAFAVAELGDPRGIGAVKVDLLGPVGGRPEQGRYRLAVKPGQCCIQLRRVGMRDVKV